jgi:hypothetical protein
VAFLCVACASTSTTIEQSWRAGKVQQVRPRNVVTLYNSPDGAIRRTLEDKMAYKLRRNGVAATPSYAVLRTADMTKRDEVRDELLAQGFDGIVATRQISDTGEYGGAAWPMHTDTNYVYDRNVVRLETAVYLLDDGRLVWSALSRTVDPVGASAVIDEVTTLVARELTRQGVFVATRY